jgi:hypothetical protein
MVKAVESPPEQLQLTTAQRQLLLAAFYRRQVRPSTGPEIMARIAVMSDAELMDQLLDWEASGDNEVAKALAQAGLSERPVQVITPCLRAERVIESDPVAITVQVTVAELHRWQLGHFCVRAMEGFGSLRMELPIPPGAFALGYAQPLGDDAPVLSASAILTNSDTLEPMIAFEVIRAWPGRLDQSFVTAPVPLAQLRDAIAHEVGQSETLSGLPEQEANPVWVWHEPDGDGHRPVHRGG